MAAKKAVAKRGSTAMSAAKLKEQMAGEVAGIADQIGQPGGSKIKLKDKAFHLPNGDVEEGPIDVVIIDFVSKNSFYEGKYDPKNPAPPACFAIGKNIKDMVPSKNSPEPQAKSCAECPMNQFGSDGNGKACKNSRVMAVVGPDDVAADDEILILEASPTAIKRFDAYVGTVAKLFEMPPIGVVTSVSFDPSVDWDSLTFSDPQPNENVGIHFNRRPEAETALFAEPDVSGYEKPKKGRRR